MHLSEEERRLAVIADRARASTIIPEAPVEGYRRPARPTSAESDPGVGTDAMPERRRYPRVAMASQVSMRRIGGFNFEVALHDLSVAGCRVELIEAAEPGEPVIARFPHLEPIGGEICWAASTVVGLEFSRPMHVAVLDSLLERL